MTDYQKKALTYRPIQNTPENEALILSYGLSLDQPDCVAVLTVETGRIDAILPSMDDFYVLYTPIEED